MVNNLAQLKKYLVPGAKFTVTEHFRSARIGQKLAVKNADTRGFYSFNPDNPHYAEAFSNGGKGIFLNWGSAREWVFYGDGRISRFTKENNEETQNLLLTIVLED